MASSRAVELDPITVTPVQPLIGATIEGVQVAQATEEDILAIRAALLQYKVIFFRDQTMSRPEHVALGRRFGDLEVHPLSAHPDHPEMLVLISEGEAETGMLAPAADYWHTDTTFRDTPSAASILYGYKIPPLGGDTLWCNTVAVYEGLPDELKHHIDGLEAVHNGLVSFARHLPTPESQAAFLDRHPPQVHPVVTVHPETGEKAIYVNSGFTTHIVGMSEAESRDLLTRLFDEVKRPEYQVRFRWQPGSIAFWDNRSTQHYGVADYKGHRHLERVTVLGTRPVGA